LISLKKKIEKTEFPVEKESEWANMDDYHPLWMIIVQYGWLISLRIDNWEPDDIFEKIISRR
jgi:hypothetical protein